MLREKILNYTVLAKGNGGKFVLGRIIWQHLGTITTLMEEYLPLGQSFRSENIEAAYGWSSGFPTLLSLVFFGPLVILQSLEQQGCIFSIS